MSALPLDAPASFVPPGPLDAYQKRLMFFLSVATFFEGFDFMALTQILPNLQVEMGLSKAAAGLLVGCIHVGPIIAYLLVRKADHWGRKRVLGLTIVGYTIFSMLSGFSPNVWVFGSLQLVARVFLIGEWAVAMIYAAEEFPSDRRGMVIGVIQACSALGAVVCAGLVPLLLKLPFGWRSVFFVGGLPLIIIAFARRNLKETRRFEAERAAGHVAVAPPIMRIWETAYAPRVAFMALIWGFTYVSTTTAITFWKGFVTEERGFTDAQAGMSMTIAALVAMPLVFLVGRMLDVIGRRRGATIIFVITACAVAGSYTLPTQATLTVALAFGIFGTNAVLPVLNALTAEIFPTEFRSDAFAWSNNLLGRLGAVGASFAVGQAAGTWGWGPSVAVTSVFPLVALALILWKMPETRGRELEETSRIG